PANAANAFDLREAGADAIFDTADDGLYTLRQTDFSGTGVALRLNEGSLGPGRYRFRATATVKDPAGNALDGNGDGTGGDAYQRFFTIAPPPAGYQYEHSGFGPQAPLLVLTEDPAGSGLAIGRAIGRLDPAYGNDYSDLDVWRIELEQGDRVSISVDSPASTLYPWIYLYDPAGNHNGQYDQSGYGPDADAFISAYQVQTTGTYTLVLSKDYYRDYRVGDDRGAYELHVERVRGIQQESDASYGNDTLGGANALTLAVTGTHRTATVAGTVMAAEGSNTDEDVYRLGLFNAGNVVDLRTSLPADSTLSPKVTLLDANGVVIADTDAADGHVKATLSADGVIYAKVEALSGAGSRGQYLLEVDLSDPIPPRVTGVTGLPADGATVQEPVGPTVELSFSEVLDGATVRGTQGVWRYGGHTYTLTPRSMSWTEAEAEASRLGGHLVTIDDAAEQAWVSETFGGWGGWYAWLGATDQAVEGSWVWADGQPIDYQNWDTGQPRSHGSYDYAYLAWNGRWSVTDNTGLGTSGWGVIEIDDAGTDGDADGLPDLLDPYPANAANAFDLREAGADAIFDTADDGLYTLRQTDFSGTGVALRLNEG
ncbi:MAG TPA: lectin-like protein, partial [Nitriliruptorales bacterium]